MAASKQYVQLSILDRLIGLADSDVAAGQGEDIEFVRGAVLRDLENLLNARRNIVTLAHGFRQLRNSLLVYGLEDYVSKNPKSRDIRYALKNGIEETIAKFEPRLADAGVTFNSREGSDHHLCFAVKATLYADPVREPICFDTWFSVDRGEYRINNIK